MKVKILTILLLSFIFFSCAVGSEQDIKSIYNKSTVDYKVVKYYKEENQKSPSSLNEISNIANYYKVYSLQKSKIRIKEEYYVNNVITWYKEFSYNKDRTLNNIVYYNIHNKKIKEILYKNKKITFRSEYIYKKDKKTLLEIRRYLGNGKKDGWWVSYNKDRKPIKRVLYEEGKIKETFNYKYN